MPLRGKVSETPRPKAGRREPGTAVPPHAEAAWEATRKGPSARGKARQGALSFPHWETRRFPAVPFRLRLRRLHTPLGIRDSEKQTQSNRVRPSAASAGCPKRDGVGWTGWHVGRSARRAPGAVRKRGGGPSGPPPQTMVRRAVATACGASSAPHLVSQSMSRASFRRRSRPSHTGLAESPVLPVACPSEPPGPQGPSGSRRQASVGGPPVCQSISRIATIFNSVISLMAYFNPSRPMPEPLIPPYGMWSTRKVGTSLIITPPTSRRLAA